MKKIILFILVTVIFIVPIKSSAQDNAKVVFHSEIVNLYKLLQQAQIQKLYNYPQINVFLLMLQNDLNPFNNNGYCGINLTKPIDILALTYNLNPNPDFLITFDITDFTKFSSLIKYLLKNKVEVEKYKDMYKLKYVVSAKKTLFFYFKVVNNKIYLHIDFLSAILKNVKIKDYMNSLERYDYSEKIIDIAEKKEFDVNEKFNKIISKEKENIILYFYGKTNMLKYAKKFISLKMPKNVLNQNNSAESLTLLKLTEKELSIESYLTSMQKIDFKKIDLNNPILKYVPSKMPLILFFSLTDKNVKKIIGSLNSKIIGLNYYFQNIFTNIDSKFYLFADVKLKDNNIKYKLSELYKKFNVNLYFKVKNIEIIKNNLKKISEFYSKKFEIDLTQKPILITIKEHKKKYVFYLNFFENNNENYALLSIKPNSKTKYFSKYSNNNFIENKKLYIPDNSNSIFFIDLKNIIKQNVTDKETLDFTNNIDYLLGYTSFQNNTAVQKTILRFNSKIEKLLENFLTELYKEKFSIQKK